ncbi:TPA: type IV secretion protein Rhs, partial [Vibrio vulnificus]|nr:type IV secretion protein Rhs [Vibrio vulnificus]HDY7591083.1 HNH endonuclease [Vibrio vulnificus]
QVTHKADQASQLYYIVTDHAGTPQELCSENGEVVWQGEQALWGHYQQRNTLPNHGFRENAQNDELYCDLRYQGQIEDRESGLYYNVNRYYDADSGQYLSPDPIGFAGGLRPQAYVFNPLDWVDPLGLAKCPLKKLEERGFTGVKLNDNGGLDYSESNALYSSPGKLKPDNTHVESIVQIEYTGDYHADFEAASMKGFGQKSTPTLNGNKYVWHHLDDYDPITNQGTMQLVRVDAHNGIQHTGGVSQYKKATGKKYLFRKW